MQLQRYNTEHEALNGFFSDVFKFKKFEAKKFVGAIVKKPSRLLTGVDPWSTKVWNTVKGSHDVGLVDQWGGTSKENIAAAKKAGINIGPGMTMEKIAHVVAAFFAGQGLANAAGTSYASTALDVANSGAEIQARQNAAKAQLAAQQAAQQAALASQFLDTAAGDYYQSAPRVQAQSISPAKLPEWVVPTGAVVLALVVAASITKGK